MLIPSPMAFLSSSPTSSITQRNDEGEYSCKKKFGKPSHEYCWLRLDEIRHRRKHLTSDIRIFTPFLPFPGKHRSCSPQKAITYELPQSRSVSHSRNRSENTVANEKPATCQNHTLVTRKPTPKTSSPEKEQARAASAIPHACQ